MNAIARPVVTASLQCHARDNDAPAGATIASPWPERHAIAEARIRSPEEA
jgi:hypothetical protein